MGRSNRWWVRYGAAFLLTGASVVMHQMFLPTLSQRQPFLFGTIALVASVLYIGLGPGLLSLAITLVSSSVFILSPNRSLEMALQNVFSVLTYTVGALSIVFFANRYRQA